MTISYVGSAGTNQNKTAGTSIAISVSTTVSAGDLLIISVGTDNSGTTQGETTSISVSDTQSNSYTRRAEYTKTSGGSGDGATVAIVECIVGTQLTTSDTITITTANVVAKGVTAEVFSGTSLTYNHYAVTGGTGTSPSTSANGSSGKNCLFVGALSYENKPTNYTEDTDSWTALGETGPSTGGPASCVAIAGGYKTTTGAGETHDPTIVSADYAHAVVSWYEDSGTTHSLVIQEATHSHTADNVTLTQVHDLVVGEASHSHTADNVTLSQVHDLSVNEATHSHTADNVTLTHKHSLVIGEATHAHAADNVTLTHNHILAINEATHSHTTDLPSFTQVHSLGVNEASHAHTADNVTITENADASLIIQEATHSHTADSPSFVQVHDLSIGEATHSHTADNVTLTHNVPTPLVIQDASHGHTTDPPSFVQVHSLVVNESTHSHSAANVALGIEGGDEGTGYYYTSGWRTLRVLFNDRYAKKDRPRPR